MIICAVRSLKRWTRKRKWGLKCDKQCALAVDRASRSLLMIEQSFSN
jgi:hypothetical protein